MKILVLGIGKQGSVLVRDLIQSEEVTEIVAGDIDIRTARTYIEKLKSEKLSAERIDVTDHAKLANLMRGHFDVVASALLWKHNMDVAKAAIKVGVNYVDLGSPPQIYKLDKPAKAARVTIIPSCGLEPGIDNILAGYGARKLDKVEKIHTWCGGIPQKGTLGYHNPLRYKISWWWEGSINMSCGTAKILRNGEIIGVDKLAEPETIRFREPVGECEAFPTGAPIHLIKHLGLKDVEEAWSKTVRWPGHTDIWKKLIDLNLMRTDLRVRIRGCKITPREFWIKLGQKTLQYEKGEGDLVVLRVRLAGEKNKEKTTHSYELIDFYDKQRDITAMSRTTAYPCSIVAQMIARGDVKERGIVHAGRIGWDPFLARSFFSELQKRNINITESITHILRERKV